MAVKDDSSFHPTDALVSKRGRKRYRISVRSSHWQLRSLISAENDHFLYFPGGTDSKHIQRLNTRTHECETIKLLTFAPRCLVAEYGWLCCGSEDGDFVAIRLNESGDSNNPHASLNLDPDARLPLIFDSTREREESLLSLITQSRRSNKSLVAKSMKLANDRVNCITLWVPNVLTPAGDGAYAEPVAVLANNDRTVTLVNLDDFDRNEKTDPLDTVEYPDFVNRAIISPDGRMMIAILDDPYLYVHVREKKSADGLSRSTQSEYGWEQRQRHFLKSQLKNDAADRRGSFAACFTNSGTFLAVGTQYGTISVFDTRRLMNSGENPLVTTFQASRLDEAGAIRDMAFSPGPFDVLAWTEDRGHVGVADVRTNFVSRQILDIGDEAGVEHINIFDRNTIDPRLLDGQVSRRENPSSSTRHTVQPPSRRNGVANGSLNQPLSPSETLVLEAIQDDRRRRERTSQRNDETERNASDPSWTYLASLRQPMGEGETGRSRERSTGVSRAVDDFLGNYRDQRDRLRSNRQSGRDAAERQQPVRRGDQRWSERLGDTLAAMREQRDNQRGDSSYLSVLEILQARERTAGRADNEDAAAPAPLVNPVDRWEESALRGTLATERSIYEVIPKPDNTAGLAWSEDGRSLFIGAENGIYEFKLNVQSRKYCAGISMR